jgi:hypothetical protein
MIAKLKALFTRFKAWFSTIAVKVLIWLIWTIIMFVLGDTVGFKGLLKLVVK